MPGVKRRVTDEGLGTMPLGASVRGSVAKAHRAGVAAWAGSRWGVMGDLVYLLIVFVMFALAAGYARISSRL